MTQHLLLVDISGFVHRAYHAGSANRFRGDGLPTWAIEGTLGLLWRLLGAAQADQPTHAVACFDSPGKTFRHDAFPNYKNNRPARDQELSDQLPYLENAVLAMGLTPVGCPGFEGDDIAAALTAQAVAMGFRVTVVSSDKDLAQLVADGGVTVYDPVQHVRMDEAYVRGIKFGVEPRQVPDFQGLVGDDVDNIPGIKGIGPVNGAAFIRAFGTVEGVVKAANDKPYFFSPTQRVNLKERGALAKLQLYRMLATLRTDAPVSFDPDAMTIKPIIREAVQKLLKTLGAENRFDEIFQIETNTRRVVDPLSIGAQLEWWQEELLVPGQPVPDIPQCGYYERRLVKGGVFVPAVIWREDEIDPETEKKTGKHILRCTLGDQEADAVHEWGRLHKNPITHDKYRFKMADMRWAKTYKPEDCMANPTKPIDWNSVELR